MASEILSLPDLVKRLDYVINDPTSPVKMDEWVAKSFSQIISAKSAEKTVSGILTTAAGTFSNFIQVDLLPSFIGETTISPILEEKEIIFFKLDDARRNVVGPLLAAALHMIVVSNLAKPRKTPLAIFIDEFPSIKLDKMPQWINEYRSNGGCFCLGIQSLAQLYNNYGKELGGAIASACGTHILFNPGSTETAQQYVQRYGEKEKTIKTKSVSRGSTGGNNTSTSDSFQKMPLFTIDEIMRFPQGRCIITSPAYGSGQDGYVPFPIKIPVPGPDIKRREQSAQLWDKKLCQHLESLGAKKDVQYLNKQMLLRKQEAERILPLPSKDTAADDPFFGTKLAKTPKPSSGFNGAYMPPGMEKAFARPAKPNSDTSETFS